MLFHAKCQADRSDVSHNRCEAKKALQIWPLQCLNRPIFKGSHTKEGKEMGGEGSKGEGMGEERRKGRKGEERTRDGKREKERVQLAWRKTSENSKLNNF